MNRFRLKIKALLSEHGAVLKRTRKHKVYEFPNGKTYVESSSPSSQTSDQNQLSDLKRVLELPKTGGQEGPRRVKRPKQGRPEVVHFEKFDGNPLLAQKLQLSGAVERGLRDELAMNEVHIETLNARIRDLEARQCECWWCGLKKRFHPFG